MASHKATITIPALAKLLPSASVASKSCGSARRRLINVVSFGKRSSNWRNCHLPREKRDVSANAKKKLPPAKTARTTNPIVGVIAARLKQNGKRHERKISGEKGEFFS